ncbi:MAG: nucleotidyltransferase family protein [Armatimonadota bacterium]
MAEIKIPLDMEKIEEFCRRWKITSFALFGSVLREDFRPDSDIDVLVRFAPDAHVTLFRMGAMLGELQDLFERDVDLVDAAGVEQSRNPIRRAEILNTAKEVYRAAA